MAKFFLQFDDHGTYFEQDAALIEAVEGVRLEEEGALNRDPARYGGLLTALQAARSVDYRHEVLRSEREPRSSLRDRVQVYRR